MPGVATRRAEVGYGEVLAASLCFGVNGSIAKVALDRGIEPARLTALRCAGAALVLLVVVAARRPHALRISLRQVPGLVVLGLVSAALIQWLYFIAIDRLPIGIALLIQFTGPVLVAVWARVVQRRHVARRSWIALTIALVGLALVARVWTDTGLDPVGVAAAAAAAVCMAAFFVLGERRMTADQDPLALTFWVLAVAAVFWSVVEPWWQFEPSGLEATTWLAVASVVVLGTVVPYLLSMSALRRLPATTVGVVGTSEPVFASAVAWVWHDQALVPIQLLGGALVPAGVVSVQQRGPEALEDR